MKSIQSTSFGYIVLTCACALVIGISGCGESPPELPAAIENTGMIAIICSIQFAPDSIEYPDSIGVILDGDSLGSQPNPDTLRGILAGNHRLAVYFEFEGKTISGSDRVVEVSFAEISNAAFDIKTGSVEVLGLIDISPDRTVQPDSMGIILNGDSLGYYINPHTMTYIPEGLHSVATYTNYDHRDFQGSAMDVAVVFNEISDVRIRMTAGGVLLVEALYNSQPVSEFGILLDGMDLGIRNGPWVIPNISQGLHKVVVWTAIDTTNLEGWMQDVEVTIAETTEVNIEMEPIAPYEGVHAPDLNCTDIFGNSHSLSDHWGEVIYMYFFEYG